MPALLQAMIGTALALAALRAEYVYWKANDAARRES